MNGAVFMNGFSLKSWREVGESEPFACNFTVGEGVLAPRKGVKRKGEGVSQNLLQGMDFKKKASEEKVHGLRRYRSNNGPTQNISNGVISLMVINIYPRARMRLLIG